MSTGDDVRRAEQMEIRAYAVRLGRERMGLSGALARASMAREREFLRAAVASREGREPHIERTVEERAEAAVRADDVDEIDAGAGPAASVMYGYFAVFNAWTEILNSFEGNFLERVAPGAFATTFRSGPHIEVLLQHGRDPSIGVRPLATITRLAERARGAYFEADLIQAGYVAEVAAGIAAGAYRMSFRFEARREEWVVPKKATSHNPRKLPERTLREVEVVEFGPCTFAAYPDTSVGVRAREGAAPSPASLPLPDPVTTRSDRARVARTIEATRRGIPTTRRSTR